MVFSLDKSLYYLYNSCLATPGWIEMVIKINDIPPEGSTIEVAESIDLFDRGSAATPASASFAIRPAGNGLFRISGRVSAKPELECSRCLKHFTLPIDDAVIDIELAPGDTLQQEAEHELNRAELDVAFYQGDEIDLSEIIKEQLLLSIPMVPVHRPDCKGLCPVCGTDRNEQECRCSQDQAETAGPFSRLKDLLKKKE